MCSRPPPRRGHPLEHRGMRGRAWRRASAPRRTRPSSRLPRRAERRRRRRRRRRDPAPGVLANVWHPHGGRAPDNPRPHHLHRRRPHGAGGGGGRDPVAQPRPLGPLLGADPLRDSRTVHRTAGGVPRRGPGDRLRRCHRRAVPVRHHVPRRRQAREHRERSLRGQRPLAVVLMVVVLAAVIALGVNAHWATGVHHLVAGPARPRRTRRASGARCSPPTCSPSRPPPACSSSPWSGRSSSPAGPRVDRRGRPRGVRGPRYGERRRRRAR